MTNLNLKLLHAMEGKKTLFETVDFDWNLGAEDSTDFSDDEATVLDDPSVTPEKKRRPSSFMIESPYKSASMYFNSQYLSSRQALNEGYILKIFENVFP